MIPLKPNREQQAIKPKQIFGLNPNVFFLGLVSFLTDASSEMIFPLLPLFLRNVLATPYTVIGLIEGASESIASLVRVFSGWLSDKLGRRKGLTIAGYGLSAFAKPFMYVATTWGIAFGVRFADRVGKGIRTAPRDALIADSLSAEQRGARVSGCTALWTPLAPLWASSQRWSSSMYYRRETWSWRQPHTSNWY